MNETEFAKAYIEQARSSENCEVQIHQEVHYNHYGSRGCVDLVLVKDFDFAENEDLRVIELKSEYALDQVTGANEIIRQMNKHYTYFFDGTEDFPRRKYENCRFWLLFYATPKTYRHVEQNLSLYKSAENSKRGNQYNVALWHEELGLCSVFAWENNKRTQQLREKIGVDE